AAAEVERVLQVHVDDRFLADKGQLAVQPLTLNAAELRHAQPLRRGQPGPDATADVKEGLRLKMPEQLGKDQLRRVAVRLFLLLKLIVVKVLIDGGPRVIHRESPRSYQDTEDP